MLRAISNARLVSPEGVIEGASIVVEDGRIAGVSRYKEGGGGVLDAEGRYLLPGLVDLHSDAIEKQVAPRPGAEFPPKLAFLEMDRLFASAGITTGFHALVYRDYQDRSVARARGLYDLISARRKGALVRHELHLRCELPEITSVEAVEATLLSRKEALAVSVMDHTPGRGKFKSLGWFRQKHLQEHPGATEDEVVAAFEEVSETGELEYPDRIERIARAARARGILLCSHDDDTPEKVGSMARHGVRLSEFPVDAATARRARELGLEVCMGAPNVVRGRSTGGSIPATEAVRQGLVDALVSDYHPPSMLQAAFKLAREGVLPLHGAVGLVSSGPARAVGLDDRGEVREGALADLIVVGERLGLPVVTHAIVGGEPVLACEPPARGVRALAVGAS